ncbi:MAG: competence protein CoiA [Bacilli bacterium]
MRYAKNSKGEIIPLIPSIIEKSQGTPLFCITCGEQLLWKQGKMKRAHVAHPNVGCKARKISPTEHSGGEGKTHADLKQKIATLLNKNGFTTTIEYTFSPQNMRADIFIHKPATAVEIQCSSIPPSTMLQRVRKYQKQKIEQVWLLSNRNVKTTNNTTTLSATYVMCIAPEKEKFIIRFLCDRRNVIEKWWLISSLTTRNFLAYKLQSTDIATNKTSSEVLNQDEVEIRWNNHIEKWMNKPPVVRPYEFNAWLYNENLRSNDLPPYLPVPSSINLYYATHPSVWQWYLWRILNQNSTFTLGDVLYYMDEMEQRKQIKRNMLPLCEPQYKKSVVQWLTLLCEVDCMKKEGSTYTIEVNVKKNRKCYTKIFFQNIIISK